MQQTQTMEFVITKKGKCIDKVGRSSLCQPETGFSGGSIKWYKDKPKKESM